MEEQILQKIASLELLIKEQNLLQKEMLNLDEASKYLNISASYMYKLTSARIVPHYCPNGKKVWFKKSELDQFLQKNRQVSREEMETEAVKYLLKNRQL